MSERVSVCAAMGCESDDWGLMSRATALFEPSGAPHESRLGIGEAGASDAALLAVQTLSNKRPELREAMGAYRPGRDETVLAETLP